MLKVENLFLKKGDFILNQVSFDVNNKEYVVMLGKTGSGKTLLLESIAGFHRIEGKIYFEGRDITNFPPEKRNFGFLYQDFQLFKNLNVEKNIRFSEKFKGKDNKLFNDLINFLN
ncbi:ATP-binding cassette domain-containing protein [Lebetimonas sp. JH369]|nr:ATP-binding cassette domain-containing protein [Lebetimonas sp. JH369]